MRPIVALVILTLVGSAATHVAGASDRVFGDRFVGDGVRYRQGAAGDVLYPVNINNFWGYANQNGDLIIKVQYDWADYFYGGLARVVMGARTGFINTNGQWFVLPNKYVYADRFEEGLAIIGDGRKFGFLNRFGDEAVPIEMDGALRFREGLAAVKKRGRIAFYNPMGRKMIGFNFIRARSFHQGMAMVQEPDQRGQKGRLGYINPQGEFVWVDKEKRFSDLGSFSDSLAPAKVKDQWGFIDRQFKLVIEPTYQEVRGFYGGLAAIMVGRKWGYINKEGQIVIEPQFNQAYDFREVLAMVKLDRKYGYIDREGRLAIALQFKQAEPFFRDCARVNQKPNFGYLGINANIVWDPRGPLDAIFDLTQHSSRGQAVRITPPPRQEAVKIPYQPDYLYHDVLPKPRRSRARHTVNRQRN